MPKSKRSIILASREKTYGSYKINSHLIQQLKKQVRSMSGWERMSSDKQQSIDMIFTKIGRIITGDSNHLDSWADIKGYTELVEEIILTQEISKP